MNVITAVLALIDSHSKYSRDLAEIKKNTGGLPALIADVKEIKADVKQLAADQAMQFQAVLGELDQIKTQLDRIEAAVTAAPRLADFGWSESQPRKR